MMLERLEKRGGLSMADRIKRISYIGRIPVYHETHHRHHRPAECRKIDALQPAGRGGRAIVIDEPGATRDRNYAECHWQDRPLR